MALFRLQINSVTRSTGRSATAAAAYRAGERIRDERTGALYNHSKRADVLYKEILLPSKFEHSDPRMQWARDRSTLWNAAERVEQRSNSRVAREYQVALPAELTAEQQVALVRGFSREIAERYNVAVDLAIHAPRPEGDPRNFHAHLLATTREVTPEGLGPKTGLDRDGRARSELGLPTARQEFTNLRARWAELTNEALREANLEARVDHRTLEAQGIDRTPGVHLPRGAFAAEKRGEHSEVAERIRNRYRQRAAARKAKGEERAAEGSSLPQDMEARRRQAVQDWLNYRSSLEATAGAQGRGNSPLPATDEIRRRAVKAWRSLQARGAESHSDAASPREPHTRRESVDFERARNTPGLDDDL